MKHLIVIPAFNEEAALRATVDGLQVLPDEYEILIVNDGSMDETGSLAEALSEECKLRTHVVHLSVNCGIGVAVQTGYRFAAFAGRYHYVVQFDADGQHNVESVPRLVEECERSHLDLCVGSRFLDSVQKGFQSTLVRRVGIRILSRLISTLTGTRVTDPTSGLRCSGPKAWKRFATHYGEDYPEPESVYWCLHNRLKYAEIPVLMRARATGVSSIGSIGGLYSMLKVILAILIERMRKADEVTS